MAGIANALKDFRVIQVGKETTLGISVAATRMLRVLDLSYNGAGSWRHYRPRYSIGRVTLQPDVGTITRKGFEGRIETDLSFEDILLPLLMGFEGGVTGGTVGPDGQYTWTFQNDPNAGDPAPDPYTLEFRMSDGTTNWDKEVPGLLCSAIEISWDSDSDAAKLSFEVFGRSPVDEGSFAALSLPTPFEVVPALKFQLGISANWATMVGGSPTEKDTTLRSMTWRYNTGITPGLFAGDGRLDYSNYRFGRRGVELTMECEWNATIAAERTAFEAGSKRYIGLEALGSLIGGTTYKQVSLWGSYIYNDNGFGEIGRDDDGKEVVTLGLMSVADDDTNDTKVEIINSVATFP
jgi:hypothetical protein